MGMSRISIGLIAMVCLAGSAVIQNRAPAADKPKIPPIPAAVAALQKEYQAHLKIPKTSPLRGKSDYFKENAADITPDSIVKALETSVSGPYPTDAYVKWQLLSGMPAKIPDELVKRAIAVYRHAPAPANNPGLDHRAMNKAIMGVQKNRIPDVQKEFDSALADNGKVNHIVLSYRDELYTRLPATYDVLLAGLEDAGERASCGLNASGFFATVSGGIRAWTLTQPKPGQVQNMLDQAMRIKDAVAKDANKPYHKLVDENGVKWKVEGAMIDTKKLDELIKFLQANVAATSGGGLKFKDDK